MRAVPDAEPHWAGLGRYGAVNVAVVAAQVAGWALLLSAVDAHALPLPVRAGALMVFCLMMQGRLHDAARVLPPERAREPALERRDRLGQRDPIRHRARRCSGCSTGGTIAGTAPRPSGPSSFTPGETRWGKTATYYAAILGGIWLGCLVAPLVAVFVPHRLARRLVRHEPLQQLRRGLRRVHGPRLARAPDRGCGARGRLGVTDPRRAVAPGHARRGLRGLRLHLVVRSMWVYHLHTPLHVVEGAYNLRAPAPVRLLFLNFNYNLTHHRHPEKPWQELMAASDPRRRSRSATATSGSSAAPVPFPEDPAVLEKSYF